MASSARNGSHVFGLPITAFYVLAMSVIALGHTEFTCRSAARSTPSAPTRRRRSSTASRAQRTSWARLSLPACSRRFAGVLLASKLQIGQASVGLEFLLPALVGAFLGSTTIKPGRVNVWGTLTGVAILASASPASSSSAAAFYVEPLFNGLTLLVAIGIAGWAQQRRNRSIKRRIAERQLDHAQQPVPSTPSK
jgi:ribose transport system permease protein